MAGQPDEDAVRRAHDLIAMEDRPAADLLALGLLARQLDPALQQLPEPPPEPPPEQARPEDAAPPPRPAHRAARHRAPSGEP